MTVPKSVSNSKFYFYNFFFLCFFFFFWFWWNFCVLFSLKYYFCFFFLSFSRWFFFFVLFSFILITGVVLNINCVSRFMKKIHRFVLFCWGIFAYANEVAFCLYLTSKQQQWNAKFQLFLHQQTGLVSRVCGCVCVLLFSKISRMVRGSLHSIQFSLSCSYRLL